LLFVGQIKLETPSYVYIRAGIFSTLVVLYLIVISIYSGDFGPSYIFDMLYSITNLAILFVLVGVLYFRLLKSLKHDCFTT
jgi:hypothetical protein